MAAPAAGEAPPPQLWTIGHSTHPVDTLAAALRACNIAQLFDVRTVPRCAAALAARARVAAAAALHMLACRRIALARCH
jgi:hypothetical protein